MVRPVDQGTDGVGSGALGLPGRTPQHLRQLWLAVALGDPEREAGLLAALQVTGEFAVTDRYLAADQLLAAARGGRIDAVLLAWDLHRLGSSILGELDRSRIPLVLLAPQPDAAQWQGQRRVVLPLDAAPDAVLDALRAVTHPAAPRPYHQPLLNDQDRSNPRTEATRESRRTTSEPTRSQTPAAAMLSPIVIGSGSGSPGRTTVALNLAAALGAVAPTVLVEADLQGPSLAAYLDADPTRNLALLAHAAPESPRAWDDAIARETQPLGPRSPYGVVLCGIPKPELQSTISDRFLTTLLTELQARYQYVLLDIGPSLLGPEAEVHRAALAGARQLLLVASSDLVGLWRARTALTQWHAHLGLLPQQIHLVINRHDPAFHHDREEMEWALGVKTAAMVPYDHRGIQRAAAAQRPVVLAGRSRAGRALLAFAERVHHGAIVLPPEPATNARGGWLHWRRWFHVGWPWSAAGRPGADKGKEAADGATSLLR